jgi:hypothetical protein
MGNEPKSKPKRSEKKEEQTKESCPSFDPNICLGPKLDPQMCLYMPLRGGASRFKTINAVEDGCKFNN